MAAAPQRIRNEYKNKFPDRGEVKILKRTGLDGNRKANGGVVRSLGQYNTTFMEKEGTYNDCRPECLLCS